MKILYAIQGTGNGHLSRARDIIPILQKWGKVDLLISSCHSEVKLPYSVKYNYKGLGFAFGKNGGIDYIETFRKNNIKKLYKEINDLPVKEYNLVISDFEPVSAWACYFNNTPCVGLSHQIGVSSKHAPKPPTKDLIGSTVLKLYAPTTHNYGFHFIPYDENIFTPVIRKEVRSIEPVNEGHYTVYLPSYNDKRIIKFLSNFTKVRWEVFSKHCKSAYRVDHIAICPVSNESFLKSIAGAEGVLCGAGFETPAEVLYLEKKLMVIPMKGQYEQQCNAAALQTLGIPVIKKLKAKQVKAVSQWLESKSNNIFDFPDDTEFIIQTIIEKHASEEWIRQPKKQTFDKPSRFRNFLHKKIFYQPTDK